MTIVKPQRTGIVAGQQGWMECPNLGGPIPTHQFDDLITLLHHLMNLPEGSDFGVFQFLPLGVGICDAGPICCHGLLCLQVDGRMLRSVRRATRMDVQCLGLLNHVKCKWRTHSAPKMPLPNCLVSQDPYCCMQMEAGGITWVFHWRTPILIPSQSMKSRLLSLLSQRKMKTHILLNTPEEGRDGCVIVMSSLQESMG